MALREALELSKKCCHDLGRADATCCLSGARSPLFHIALEQLRAANHILSFGPHTVETLQKCHELFEQCAGTVGELHGTCCTPFRTDCYTRIRRWLNEAIQKVDEIVAASKAVSIE